MKKLIVVNGYTQSPRSGAFIFKMAAMLQIPRVCPCISCLGSTKAVQCPRPGQTIGEKSQQIPRYALICPRGQPPGMAADKCIIQKRYGHVRAKRFRLSTSKTDGTHCSKTLKRCLKIFLIRTNKNKIVLLCFTLNFSHVIFLFFSGNDIFIRDD